MMRAAGARTVAAMSALLEQIKAGTRATWAAGDFHDIARNDLWPMGERIVKRARVLDGEDVLDVGCGTGNAAIRAAQAGGRVVGVDLTPELFGAARSEAAAAGVLVEWVEGDAEQLPFEDESFDAVLSVFGAMFAPRHRVTAHELARVLRPGGRLVMFNWAPDAGPARFFRQLASFMPPAPDVVEPSAGWGDRDHVREIFEGTGVELSFDTEYAPNPFSRFATVDERIEHYTTVFGPMIMLKRRTEADGRWPELRAVLEELYEDTDDAEYLVVGGRKI